MPDSAKKQLIEAMMHSINDSGIDSLRKNFLDNSITFESPNNESESPVPFPGNYCSAQGAFIYRNLISYDNYEKN